jgi:7,8-dihydro-6-hydroxymethylpterin-pyrophosphokinase|tara:strand:- start:219 stop:467 length:249 start_codon:yes stop_codon:yes gene_type:complete
MIITKTHNKNKKNEVNEVTDYRGEHKKISVKASSPDFTVIKYNPNQETNFYNTVLLNKTQYKEYKKELYKLHKKLFKDSNIY